MRLKNILLVVENVEKSVAFYKDLFGLQVQNDFGGNVILTEGLALQDKRIWESLIGKETVSGGDASVLYFADHNLEAFQKKLDESGYEIQYLHRMKVYEWEIGRAH